MKRTIILSFTIAMAAATSTAQLPTLPSSQLSPNATSLGEYGEVPVSLFSGIPQIEIPLYTIEVGEHQVPITLSYHGGGVKVDQHPGWTGLGWTLMAGGSISRTVNDTPDEYDNKDCNVVTFGNPEEMGYLWKYPINSTGWDSSTSIGNKVNSLTSTFVTTLDTEPDKFSFNFLGYSGNFWLGHDGEWKVLCDKDIKVELGKVSSSDEVTDSFTMKYNEHTNDFHHHGMINSSCVSTNAGSFGRSPSIKTFTLTGEDGTKYIFGDDEDAIEFSVDYFAQSQAQVVANTWNLKEIRYPDGRTVNFNYQRGPFSAQFYGYQSYVSYSGGKSSFWWILPHQDTDGQYRFDTGKAYGGNLIFPSYLESIIFDNGTLSFFRGESVEKSYDYTRITDRFEQGMANANPNTYNYLDYLYPLIRLNSNVTEASDALKWYQLNSISVSASGAANPVVKRILFDYSSDNNTRLTLNSIAIDDNDPYNGNTGIGGRYTFEYNHVDSLPDYCSWHTDHWGYYNGRTHTADIRSNGYSDSREPDFTKAAYGSLTKITYPTGGYTRFEYEHHDYSRQVSEDHTSCETQSGNAAGLRIKRLLTSATGDDNDETEAKRFVYKRNYTPASGGGESSGALLQRMRYKYDPYYLTNISGTTNEMSLYRSSSIIPCMDTFGGSHVGYSEVAEILPDSTYTIYRFSNIDTGALDSAPDYSKQNHTVYEPYSSRSQERGLILGKSGHSPTGNKTSSTGFEYEKDDNTSLNNVRSIKLNQVASANSAANVAFEGTAYRFYTYSMRQTAQHDTVFDGNNAYVTRTLTEYNPQKLIKKTTRSIGCGIDEETTFTYPADHTGENFAAMTAAHIFSPLVEKVVRHKENGSYTNVFRQFNHFTTNMVKPSSIDTAPYDRPYLQTAAYTYDKYFNPKTVSDYGVVQKRYLWSYKGAYPIAFLDGGEYPVVGVDSLEENYQSNYILNADALKSLIRFEYEPLKGVKKRTDQNGDVTYYYYDNIGRYVAATDADGNLREKIAYHYPASQSDKASVSISTVTQSGNTSQSSLTNANSMTTVNFVDGLGRPLQTVEVGASTSGGDIADLTEYNPCGLPSNKWLAGVGIGGGAFTPLSSLQSSYSSIYTGESSHDCRVTTEYEKNPAHRPVERRRAGYSWQSNTGATAEYKVNTASGVLSAVRLRAGGVPNAPTLSKVGTYPAGELLVEKTADEDGKPLWTFTDKAGNKVLERRQPDPTQQTYADTYFVYDRLGNLRYAISPEGSALINNYANGEISNSDNAVGLFSHIYYYDTRNRLNGKKEPGIMAKNYISDNLDRVRFSNDGNHNVAHRWTATEYDRYNRVAFTADFATSKSYNDLYSSVVTTNDNVSFGEGPIFGYTVTPANSQNGGNFTVDDIISVNYYDDYGFLSKFATMGGEYASVKQKLDYVTMNGYGTKATGTRAAYGLTTGTVRRVLWPDGATPSGTPLTGRYIFRADYYDCHGRLVQSRETNLLGGQENYYYDLSFTGKPLRVRHEHVTADTTITETTTYTYDNRERLKKTTHAIGNATETTLRFDRLNALGQVTWSHYGGTASADAVTSVNYTYNANGALKSLASPEYTQTLYYDRRSDQTAGLLNGNICEQEFTLNQQRADNSLDRYEGKFRYEYDGMNRLTYATTTSFSHKSRTSDFPGLNLDIYANTPHYSERISYDLNSNITSFSRRGYQRNIRLQNGLHGKFYGLLDSLVIYRGGNQPRMITDMATTDYGHPAEYRDGAATWYEKNHDKNGNMTCDLDRGVDHISYNLLNLPDSIAFADGHATYNIYDSDGRKLRTVHIVAYDPVVMPGGETVIPTDTIVRDYCAGFIYDNGELERLLTPSGYYADGKYHYYIRDYQGNNVAVVTRTNNVADVVSATLTYPYGCELTELSATDRYRFGGKELDTHGGLFHYDFAARWYDPVFPQFTTVDPLSEKYPHISPFTYCAGNPIMYIDPSGEDYNVEVTDNAVLIKIFVFTLDDEAYALAKQASDIVNANSYKRAVEVSMDSGKEILPVVFQSYVLRVEGSEADVSPSIVEMKEAGIGGNLFLYKDEINNYKNGGAKGDEGYVYKNHVDTSGAHEFGHLMGMIHSWCGIMTASSEDELRSDKFSSESVGQSIHIIDKYQIKENSKEQSNAVRHFVNNSKFSDNQLRVAKLVDYKHRR